MDKRIKRLLHKLTAYSKKGYGIHSPFVFNFQRKIVHPQPHLGDIYLEYAAEKDKQLKLLLRIKSYYKLENLLLLTKQYQKEFEAYKINYDAVPQKKTQYNFIIADADQKIAKHFLKHGTFTVLLGENKKWMQNNVCKGCQVVLDFYSFGICIFNNGLSAEKFKLYL